MLIDIFDEIMEQIRVHVTPETPFNDALFNARMDAYKVALEGASLKDIMPVFEKLKIGSENDDWFNAPYEIAVLTYKHLFSRLKISELLEEFGLFVALFNDPEENLSAELKKISEFIKCDWLYNYQMPPSSTGIH